MSSQTWTTEGGRGFIRLAYTQSEDELTEGLNRIRGFLEKNGKQKH